MTDNPAPAARGAHAFAWLMSGLPLLALVTFVLDPVWHSLIIGALVVAVASVCAAFLDTRRLSRSGVVMDDSAWPSAIVVPPAYLVQRTLAARSSWLIPVAWFAAVAVVAGVAVTRVESRLPASDLESTISGWFEGQGVVGGMAVDCPALAGRPGTTGTCTLADGSTVEVELLGGEDIELRVESWKAGLVEQTVSSWMGSQGLGGPLKPTCAAPDGDVFEVTCSVIDGSRITMTRAADGQLGYRFLNLGKDMVGQAAISWLVVKKVTLAPTATVDCPELAATGGASVVCVTKDGSRIQVAYTDDGEIQRKIQSLSGTALETTIDADVAAAATPGAEQDVPPSVGATCPALRGGATTKVLCEGKGDAYFEVTITADDEVEVRSFG